MIDLLIVRLGFIVEVDELLRSVTWNAREIICGQLKRLGFSFFNLFVQLSGFDQAFFHV